MKPAPIKSIERRLTALEKQHNPNIALCLRFEEDKMTPCPLLGAERPTTDCDTCEKVDRLISISCDDV